METKLQNLETTSERTDFAEQIHSERSKQEAETTSEKTELADQSTSKTFPANKLKQKYLATLTKRLLYSDGDETPKTRNYIRKDRICRTDPFGQF